MKFFIIFVGSIVILTAAWWYQNYQEEQKILEQERYESFKVESEEELLRQLTLEAMKEDTSAPEEGLTASSGDEVQDEPIVADVVVDVLYHEERGFGPKRIELQRGQVVELSLRSLRGEANLSIDEFNVAMPNVLEDYKNPRVVFTPDVPGEFVFYSQIEGIVNATGTVIVR